MGLSRRFQNLILDNRYAGAKSMLSMDLTRQLFGDTPAAANSSKPKENLAAAAALDMERIRLPSPIFTFQAPPNEPIRKMYCFPLSDRKTLWVDHLGRPLLFDPEMHELEAMTCLHKPKSMPLSLFVPNADADNDYHHEGRGSTLFVMEKAPDPELNCSTPWSDQFEAFVYCNPTSIPFTKWWQWQLLPPPPYVREHNHWQSCTRPEISSYASLGSHICISVKGVGTYCLDTASHTWRKVGNWTLPFHGRIEYAPELKLWFGFTTKARHLAAADLSSALDMDSQSQPQLLTGPWMKELYFPEEWKECKDSQLVNLGSGRFCILRFFHTHNQMNGGNIAVFTGVEVVPRVQDADGGSGKVELQMITHKSLYHESKGTTIDTVL